MTIGHISIEKGEVTMEKKEEIVVLDAGNEGTSLVGPEAFCCAGAMFPYLG